MNFPMGVLCLFLGAVFVWVASHGTSATTPWSLFQQVIAGFNGTAATATRPADPWDQIGQSVGAAAAGAAADVSGAVGSSLAHQSGSSGSSSASKSNVDSTISNFRHLSSSQAADQANDQAAAVAAQQKLRHIGNELDGTGPLAWP